MAHYDLPFDPTPYDRLPISTFFYLPVLDGGGAPLDCRIVYGNRAFAQSWRTLFPNEDYLGALIVENHLVDDETLGKMDGVLGQTPRPFSTYMPQVNLHLHFEPVIDLPAPYGGGFLTNITDYEEKEAKIHFLHNIRQMKNLAVLLRAHDDGYLEAVFVSEEFAKMMECSVEEARELMDGPGFIRATHPEDRPLVRSMLKRHVSDDGGTSLTVQQITARGHYIWCSVHYAFIDDFREHYIYCTYFNVTVLKEYEERLRSVYVSMGSSFYQVNEHTLGLFRVNLTRDVLEEVKGRDLYETDSTAYTYSEALRLRSEHFPIEAERAQFLETFNSQRLMTGYLEGRVSAAQVLYSRRRGGTLCFVEYAASLTRHPMTGDIIAFITEQECNSDKVRETLLNKILAQQFDMVSYLVDGRYGVVIGDAARIKRGSIFPTSRGGSYAQYLESQVFPVLAGTREYKDAVRAALTPEEIRRQTGIREPYVVNLVCDIDGEIYHKRFDFYSVDPEVSFHIIVKSDVTEIYREQAARNNQLRNALEEARQANVAKTAFLSSMSHEIRTPMNAIIGLDNIALQQPGLPGRTREHLEKIGVSARHLLGIINDVLDMSRIESGRMTLKNEAFSFGDFLEQINTLTASQCQDKGLRYDFAVRGRVDESYIGDDMKLKQVLINILGNAVKFTSPPGTVSFTVERAARLKDQSTLRFTIRDTGIGMDEEYLPKLFEAFSQEDATTTNAYGGSGLGMAITKNIVAMMNGELGVQSQKGVGSTFTVDVPLKNNGASGGDAGAPVAPAQAGDTPEPGAEDFLSGRRVLLAEDMAINAEIMIELLDMRAMITEHAENGQAALDMFSHSPEGYYDAVLMDMRMPVMNGLAAAAAIRALDRADSKSVPIIALTANAFDEDVQRSLQAGMDAHLSKPVEPDRLFETLAGLIGARARREK